MLLSVKRMFFASLISFLALASFESKAALISFDDILYVPGPFYNQPLTNEYAALGLVINGGFLAQGGSAVVSPPNFLLGTNNLKLFFLAPFPTVVSMYVSAAAEDVISLTATDVLGFLETIETKGWAGPHNNTPYTPRQFVSFLDPDGISDIFITSFYGLRVDAQIDDIYFSSAAVDAPPSLALLGIGLLSWASLVRSTKKRSV